MLIKALCSQCERAIEQWRPYILVPETHDVSTKSFDRSIQVFHLSFCQLDRHRKLRCVAQTMELITNSLPICSESIATTLSLFLTKVGPSIIRG